MAGRKVRARVDRRIFHKTAARTKRLNTGRHFLRGGIRL